MSKKQFLQSNSFFAFAFSRRFLPLFATQFSNALNDNLFKTALFVLISFSSMKAHSWLPASQMLNLAALLFILPSFLLSSFAGELTAKFNKATLAKLIKLMEIVIMSLAGIGFWQSNIWLLLTCLFFMGVHTTLFGPLKYAILTDYLAPGELVAGNSMIECGTFLAILSGQLLGSLLTSDLHWLIAILLIVAFGGQICSLFMKPVPPVNPNQQLNLNIYRSTRQLLQYTYQQKDLWVAIMGISWFWLIGSVYITQLPTYTQLNIGGDEMVFNLMLALFSIGIGLGSMICARLSHGQLHLSLVVPGALGLCAFGLFLVILTYGHHPTQLQTVSVFLTHSTSYGIMLCILSLGFFGGFFSIPLYTWLQTASTTAFRSHAIAANNLINGLFMVAAAIISTVLIWLFDSINMLYLLVAVGNLAMLAYLLMSSVHLREDCKSFLFRAS